MAGIDIFTVNRLVRHKVIGMTLRYAHLSPEALADAVRKLDPPRIVLQESDTTRISGRELVQ